MNYFCFIKGQQKRDKKTQAKPKNDNNPALCGPWPDLAGTLFLGT